MLSALLLLLSAALPGAAVLLLQRALDAALTPAGAASLPVLAAGFAGLSALAALTTLARTRVSKGVAWRVAADLRVAVHRAYIEALPTRREALGRGLATLTTEVDEVQYGVSALITAARNPATLAVLAVTAFGLAPTLAPWALLVVPALWVPSRWGGRRVARRAATHRDARGALVELAHQQLAGVADVRSLGAVEGEVERFAQVNEADRRARLGLEVDRVLPGLLVQTGAACVVALLLWLGGRQVAAGTLAPGALVAFGVALGLMASPLRGLSEVWVLWRRSIASLERVHAALEAAPAVPEPVTPIALPDGPLGVDWWGVSVVFDDRAVLHQLDLAVRAGEWVAVVGATGAGKSTLLGLAARVADPSAGVVRIGGVDARSIAPRALSRAVTTLRQDAFLFSRSVRENLILGRPDAPHEALEDAVRRAGASALVARLGWDAPIDPRRLSGGERQRLALARSFVQGARVWLLDEPTNQVDSATRDVIVRALHARPAGVTVVLVTHDRALAAQADRVVRLEQGRLHAEAHAESGREPLAPRVASARGGAAQ